MVSRQRPFAELDIDAQCLFRALDPFHAADRRDTWSDGHAVLLSASTSCTSPVSGRTQNATVGLDSLTGLAVAHWARIDNRSQLAARLGTNPDEASILAAAYQHHRGTWASMPIGAFSVAMYDAERSEIALLRDPIGVRPLFYAVTPDLVVAATTGAVFPVLLQAARSAGLEMSLTPTHEWIARYAVGRSMSVSATPWAEVLKLPPGHHVTIGIGSGAAARPTPYFAFDAGTTAATVADAKWVTSYRSHLRDAVERRIEHHEKNGVETTGGLDSSACLAVAAGFLSPANLHEFGFVHSERDPDFIAQTGRRYNLTNSHILNDPERLSVSEMRERVWTVLGYPAEQGNASGHDPFYALCQSAGIRSLLSGFGGDEAVTSHADQYRFELAGQHRYIRLSQVMTGGFGMRMARTMRFLRQRESVALARATGSRDRQASFSALRAGAAELLMSPGDAAATGPPLALSPNDWVVQRLQMPYVSTRLENGSLMARSRNVEYSWPLLDVPLIQQWLRTPSIEKYGPGGVGRYLHRRAIADIVPPEVAWKPSKNVGAALRGRQRLPGTDEVHGIGDLHPIVGEIVDLDRLLDQARAYDGGRMNVSDPSHRTFVGQLAGIGAVNAWLNHSHSAQ